MWQIIPLISTLFRRMVEEAMRLMSLDKNDIYYVNLIQTYLLFMHLDPALQRLEAEL